MASKEERDESARKEFAEAQAKADREKELTRRAERDALRDSQENLIPHGPVRE